MSADNTNETSQKTDQEKDTSKGNDVLATRLAEVQEQLRQMNASMEATQTAIAAANKRQVQVEEKEDNLYDPKQLLAKSEEVMNRRLREEKAKDNMIYSLAQEYPEIQTDTKLRNAILDAQKGLREDIRDTADGYEMAVLKAVSKAGLTPKSKRQTVDEDISTGPRGGNPGTKRTGRVKVSEKTLAIAQLMGRDISDPEVLKRLEEASNRDRYDKYR